MCISWTIKGLISLMHGIAMKISVQLSHMANDPVANTVAHTTKEKQVSGS